MSSKKSIDNSAIKEEKSEYSPNKDSKPPVQINTWNKVEEEKKLETPPKEYTKISPVPPIPMNKINLEVKPEQIPV